MKSQNFEIDFRTLWLDALSHVTLNKGVILERWIINVYSLYAGIWMLTLIVHSSKEEVDSIIPPSHMY